MFDVKPGPLEGSNGLMLSLGPPEGSTCLMLSLSPQSVSC